LQCRPPTLSWITNISTMITIINLSFKNFIKIKWDKIVIMLKVQINKPCQIQPMMTICIIVVICFHNQHWKTHYLLKLIVNNFQIMKIIDPLMITFKITIYILKGIMVVFQWTLYLLCIRFNMKCKYLWSSFLKFMFMFYNL
jgi:hypothetical protein